MVRKQIVFTSLPLFFLSCFLILYNSCGKSFNDTLEQLDNEGRSSYVKINGLNENTLLMATQMTVSGSAYDKGGIETVELEVNGLGYQRVSGKEQWQHYLNLQAGENIISLRLINDKKQVIKSSPYFIYCLWKKIAELPVPLSGAGIKQVDGNIFLYGGFTLDFDFLPAADYRMVFNTQTASVQSLSPSLYHAVFLPIVFYHQAKLNILGGLRKYNLKNKASELLQTYDPFGLPANLPITLDYARGGSASIQIAQEVYIFGGEDGDGNPSNTILRYTIGSGFTQLNPSGEIMEALAYQQAFLYNNKIYVIGGKNQAGLPVQSIYIYDINANTLSKLTNRLGYERYGFTLAHFQDKVYLMGGYGKKTSASSVSVLNVIECFDPASGTSIELRPMPLALALSAAAVQSHRILLFGGENDADFPTKNGIYEYFPQYDDLNQ